ncbi:aminotransferase class I/II-fold pyridoxal phosphate-dependent enzyme [Sporosarcina sp. PTS2304]|uniref:aminotransferase class I/II-fold pyridoxal phosphate-dependent enzyme n=1 Tax=Sporosarcina sp. PTS2304 TaxID=2283194 RepID=UPI000E0CC99B|nr:aminotransferase class I/II-fold pyridoxal phosphate-dependent enzyme [Sporosarcina sp. PTS2304]AXI00704.1 aminotransferase class I/II-fold pyridoxal phosphate-dependent enzyme [Sporosarcina sp. PTS2304]
MTYKDRPLVQALESFYEEKHHSFHVPGHKHGTLSGLPRKLRQALAYDVTELTGLDDLHEPQEAIQHAEIKLAKLYGSKRSFFLVNGSTVGNLAMIYATVGQNDRVLVQRNAHKSIFHALELTGAKPIFLSPTWDESTQTAGCVEGESVKTALIQFPDVKAAIFTNPTYYGLVNKELKEIISCCHAKGIPVLVDEAHGAHFVADTIFPDGALQLGADVVVQSAHKTLPAMTMGSFLHVKSELVSIERVAHFLHMLQSSSPSYVIMASLDDARYYAASYTAEDGMFFQVYRQVLLNNLQDVPNVYVIETDDPVKLLVRVEGYTGFMVQEALEKQGIYTELADLYQVLWILPLLKVGYNSHQKKLVEKCRMAVESLKLLEKSAVPPSNLGYIPAISTTAYHTKKLSEMKKIWCNMDQAIGFVAAEAIVPYPPGIPLLCAGERILQEHITYMKTLIVAGSHFQGAVDLKTNQLKVVVEEGGDVLL